LREYGEALLSTLKNNRSEKRKEHPLTMNKAKPLLIKNGFCIMKAVAL